MSSNEHLRADVVAGGVESMTHAPLLFHDRFRTAMAALQRAGTIEQRAKAVLEMMKAPWKPRIALLEGLTDPVVNLNMGQAAEILAREFNISRREQDEISLQSHQRADRAWNEGWFNDEVTHLFALPKAEIREQATLRSLQQLYFR
ncbi:MAG: hypothetical protein RQ867_06115 [Mariprofundaceae bacterium]|nr:hypothetical protein [Mariprofundaceae bacterium]